MVEFMIVVPVFLLVVLGIAEFAHIFATFSAVSSGIRESVRYGSVTGDGSSVIPYLDCEGIRGSVKSGAGALIQLDDSEITVAYDHGDSGNPIGICGEVTAGELQAGDRLVVSVSTSYSPLTGFLGTLTEGFPISFTAARTIFIGGVLPGSLP